MSTDSTDRRTLTLTGIQPTGDLHLGNYAGAIQPLPRLAADERRDVFVFVADLHALNSHPDPAALAERTQRIAAALLACGLDRPERASLPPEPRAGHRPAGDAAGQRDVQGAAQPRARLQGGGRRQRRRPAATPTTASTSGSTAIRC